VLVGHDILFRILLPSKQMGKVIGKGGCRIEKIRNLTKANIKIADAIAVLFTLSDFLMKLYKQVWGGDLSEKAPT
jgi:predicted PilT family ATPase